MRKSPEKTSVPHKAAGRKQTKPVPDRKQDSKDIERAVYDGMQDLRVRKVR
jgi:hypothetical protein